MKARLVSVDGPEGPIYLSLAHVIAIGPAHSVSPATRTPFGQTDQARDLYCVGGYVFRVWDSPTLLEHLLSLHEIVGT